MLSTVVALVAAAALGSPAATQAVPAAPNTATQVVTVSVSSATSTTGVLSAWERASDGTAQRVRGPIRVYVGADGVGRASEQRSRTPAGIFTLTEGFGLARDPGTSLPYVRVGLSHWWVSDTQSRYYNRLRVCSPGAACGFRQDRSEQLGAISLYEYAIVIDYNRDPVIPGRGSAFFLHVSGGEPTQGCISMARRDVKWLLRWLEPGDDPVISIGVGSQAYAPVR